MRLGGSKVKMGTSRWSIRSCGPEGCVHYKSVQLWNGISCGVSQKSSPSRNLERLVDLCGLAAVVH